MHDMLVKLYELPDYSSLENELKDQGIIIRPALAAEKSIVVDWIRQRFDDGWASEGEVSFSFEPVRCFIALKDREILGFACYDVAYRNFFGPTAVDPPHRNRGIGKVLLWKSLTTMRAQGYAYAIIGGVGPAEYYTRVVGAELIKGSNPGIYRGILSHVPV